MSLDLVIEDWETSSREQRFTTFVAWVESSITGFPTLVEPSFVLVDGTVGGDCAAGYKVSNSVFEQATSDEAVELGFNIIQQCSNLAQKRWLKSKKEEEKQRNKQIDKWLEKIQKELQKEIHKAYQEMAKYYAKKYELEKGS